MNHFISETALFVSQSFELSILIKSTLLLVLGLAIATLAIRSKASTRHLIVATTLLSLLSLPMIVATFPYFSIEIPSAQTAAQAPSGTAEAASAPAGTTQDTGAITEAAASQSESSISAAALLRGVWVVGSLLLIGSLALDLWRVRALRRNGLPHKKTKDLTASIASENGLQRPVEVLFHEDIRSPVTYGLLRPVVMMPVDARGWAEADLRRAIVHELEHIRRGDWATQLAARSVCAFYWFHPLVWMAWRKLCLEAERACDDAVVQNSEHVEYADQLVALSQQLSEARTRPVLSMASRSDLSRRVTALLDTGQRRGRAGLVAAAASVVIATALVFSVGPLHAVAQSVTSTASTFNDGSAEKDSPLDRALFAAAEEGSTDEIEKLLGAGADVNCKLDGDGSPLIGASRNGHTDAVTLLLDRGADVNMAVEGDGSPLIAAAREGHVKIVELLLNRGANVDLYVPDDENALISASGSGKLGVVKLLVARGADINARFEVKLSNNTGETEWRTALGMARKGGHSDVVAYLESIGARE
ncbi:MAG: ankyrin repeat domain-containing protein [Acidobacteriota bacterium]|nr:MAG: ankyrin repeat domain-containing protein [Acidobacteriota bacterium]